MYNRKNFFTGAELKKMKGYGPDFKFQQVPFDVKANTEKMTFEGYASTFGNTDFVGDVVEKGAFKKTIRERFNGGTKKDIKILWQHFDPLGVPTHMEEDTKGLYVEGKISNTQLGRDAITLINDGVVDKLSIGYDIIKDELDHETGVRKLKELKLYEFSPVTFPANFEADITGSKADALAALEKELKEGRTLSQVNKETLESVITALQSLLSAAGAEPEKSTRPGAGNKDTKPQMITINELEDIMKDFKSISESNQ